MRTKLEREINGPSWTEVILGAVLSLLVGAVLAAAFLVLKPVATVRELPKEPVAGVVYYQEGSRDSGKARQAPAKEKTLLQGGSIVLNEDELNSIAAPHGGAPKAATAKASAAGSATSQTLSAGAPNFRIRDGVMQIAVPLQIQAFGLEHAVIAQARGGFEKHGDVFVFEPREFYVGSCPVERLPGVEGLLMKRFLAASAVPPGMIEAWKRLSEVAVEGSTVRLAVQ